jgi:hypothetical protein
MDLALGWWWRPMAMLLERDASWMPGWFAVNPSDA